MHVSMEEVYLKDVMEGGQVLFDKIETDLNRFQNDRLQEYGKLYYTGPTKMTDILIKYK